MRKKILSCILIVLLVIFVVPDRSVSVPMVIVIPAAAIGIPLLAAGAQYVNDHYADISQAVNTTTTNAGNFLRGAWEAQKMVNSLGFDYMVGRSVALRGNLADFAAWAWDNLQDMSGFVQDWLNDMVSDFPGVGDIADATNQTKNISITGDWQFSHGLSCSTNGQTGNIYYGWSSTFNAWGAFQYRLNYIREDGYCTYYYMYFAPGTLTDDPVSWEPNTIPPVIPPDAITDFGIGLGGPSGEQIQDDIDRYIKSPAPAIVPIDPAAPDADTAPPLVGLTPGELEAPVTTTEPDRVAVGDDAPPTPDATIDNDLLRGIYNNTLATARNTASTVTAIQNLALTGEPTDIQPVVDAIVALPGQIVPPLVGPIEALPAQIANPIVDKLDEIKETIPPPIESLELTGDQPALGDDNVYDTTIEEPEEESLSETILEFINNGLPFVSTLKQNAITLSNPSPSYDFVLYDHQFSFDFSPYESHLRAFGYLLYGLTVFSAFMIIVRR